MECGLTSFETDVKRTIVKSVEKAERLPANQPRKLTLDTPNARRLKRDNWRDKARDLQRYLPMDIKEDRVPITHFRHEPWMEAKAIHIEPQLEGVTSRLDPQSVKREASLQRIRQIGDPLVIYTDGSATNGTRIGGAAMVASEGDPEHPEYLDSVKKKGALYTCSYEEEVEAMRLAANWIVQNREAEESITICTDSQSLCLAMKSHNPETDDIRETLQNHKGKITIQWIPGHSGVPGNDKADDEAKKATDLMDTPRGTTYRSACMQIRRSFEDEIGDAKIREVYRKYDKEMERTIKTRKDQVTLAQIRSGKHLAFRAYRHQLDNEEPADCPRCGEAEHTLEHWFLKCPGTLEARREIFGGEEDQGLSQLTRNPSMSLALARRTLLGAGYRQ